MSGFEGLGFLASLGEDARAALLALAEDVVFEPGATVLREGGPSDSIVAVTEGVLEVTMAATGSTVLTRVGPGGIVGEASFALGRPATATVTAIERTMALRIPSGGLEDLLARSPASAAKFWRSLSGILADRLVSRTGAWARAPRADQAELSESITASLLEAEELVRRLDAAEEVPPDELDAFFLRFSKALEPEVSWPGADETVLRRLQQLAIPALVNSDGMRRCWEKPRGYAGDWETIEMMYRQEPAGVGRVGVALDAAYLRMAPCQAARNRRDLLAGEIIRAAGEDGARITSLACGPAREVFDVLEQSPDTIEHANLLDIDTTALDHVSALAAEAGVGHRLTMHEANLIKLALGRETLTLPPQDLVYSVGLIDYFPDDLVIALLDLAHGWLRPGGRVILGNFHPTNPMRPVMDLFEWSLIHRTEEDMHRLYAASAFAAPCEEILWEDQHINLFAVGVKT